VIGIATAIFTGIVIAAVSSWITVQLSLKRFRSERWWERKVKAYERVIEALHHSKKFFDNHLKIEYEGKEISDEIDKELRAKSRVARNEIEKAMDIGGFLLCKTALNRLKQYKNEADKASQRESWFEYLDASLVATDTCIKDLIKIARQDLKIKQ